MPCSTIFEPGGSRSWFLIKTVVEAVLKFKNQLAAVEMIWVKNPT